MCYSVSERCKNFSMSYESISMFEVLQHFKNPVNSRCNEYHFKELSSLASSI